MAIKPLNIDINRFLQILYNNIIYAIMDDLIVLVEDFILTNKKPRNAL
jgi:hypothetical protein